MKTYKNNGVRYYTDAFSDLKSFDIISVNEMIERHETALKKLTKKDVSYLQYGTGIFSFKDYETLVKFQSMGYEQVIYLEIPYEFIDEYLEQWTYSSKKNATTLPEVKECVKKNLMWESNGGPTSMHMYNCIKDKGFIKPIYNFADKWPKNGTHRLAFGALTFSDIPIFFPYTSNNITIEGQVNYFTNNSYSKLKIKDKLVEFYVDNKLVGTLQ